VGEPQYALKDLLALDERVEAHLDGLRVAGQVGWELCKANLANAGAGEVFALAVLAFEEGDLRRMRDALNTGCAAPEWLAGLISALGWLDYGRIARWIGRLLGAKSPLHRTVGIAACAIHREDPGPALALAVEDPDPTLRGRALRAAGEIKRWDLRAAVSAHLDDDDERCRFWSAWSATLLGERYGIAALADLVRQGSPFSERALQLVLRAMAVTEARSLVNSMAKDPRLSRLAVLGAGIVGDPLSVAWLIKKMESPQWARLAGEAFTMITGVDLAYHGLSIDPPTEADARKDADDIVPLSYESNLRWPSPVLVEHWWAEHGEEFAPGARYLGGKPVSVAQAIEVLVHGKQRLRAAAALDLALLVPERTVFEVRARGTMQERELVAWTS
jgi:uncharacterized protein (TIGR02270 family)